MKQIKPAYLAGVLDSDGSFTITKRHLKRNKQNYTVLIQLTWALTNKSLFTIKQIQKSYGGSYFIGVNHNTYKNKCNIIKYTSCGKSANKIITDVLPFLRLKDRQAYNVIKLFKLIDSYRYNGHGRTSSMTNKLNRLYLKNKKLNRLNYGDNI